MRTNSDLNRLVQSLTRNLTVSPELFVNNGALTLFVSDALDQIHWLRVMLRDAVLPDLKTTHQRAKQTVWSHIVLGRITGVLSDSEFNAMREQRIRSDDAPIPIRGAQLALMFFKGKANGQPERTVVL